MTPNPKHANLSKKLLRLGQDPQSWISMLALVTLLGVGSGALESADRPSESKAHFSQAVGPAPSQAGVHAEEQLASLDTSKL